MPEREPIGPESYCEVRTLTEALAAPLSPEDQTVQSMPDVSPTKWHRGHTTWFFEEFLLGRFARSYEPFHPAYCFLFNSYYEAVGPRHSRNQRGLISRPGVDDVAAYRDAIDAAMTDLLASPAARTDEAGGLVELGLHHEHQHQELLLMDIKHVLSKNPLLPEYRPAPIRDGDGGTGEASWSAQPGGLVDVGHAGDGFSFDNELPRHSVHLNPFEIASRPVTCGEWLAFIDDGGYSRADLWLSDGWAAVQAQQWNAPLYWRRSEAGEWRVFTLGGERAVEPTEPVCHVSYYEADAFARWAGARLPTESEWEAVMSAEAPPRDRFELHDLHPRPVAAAEPRESIGEVWEWTASPYTAYPRFRPAAGAVGEYNGKFMVNQHVLRGGSCITPVGHARTTYRNFFPPGSRWPFTGLRLARDG